jgi:hypothetical protein
MARRAIDFFDQLGEKIDKQIFLLKLIKHDNCIHLSLVNKNFDLFLENETFRVGNGCSIYF